MELEIRKYSIEYEEEWDHFVLEESINGTILQTQKFLSYHPENRFEDFSVMLYNKSKLIGVIPACLIREEKMLFYSHGGSTFGGLILDNKNYKGNIVIDILDKLEEYLSGFNISKIILKITSNIFCKKDPALLEYILRIKGYQNHEELSTLIDFSAYDKEIFPNIVQSKRSAIRQNIKKGLTFKEIDMESQIYDFYTVLTENLKKYDTKPVHTFSELLALKDNYLKDKVKFFAVFLEEKLVAGSMIFDFGKVLHTQYLAADATFQSYQPMSVLYFCLIKFAYESGYEKLSWGISTESKGEVLNETLLAFKESFGSTYSMNRTYYKEIMD